MKHKIDIWSKNKKSGQSFIIECHVEITQEEIEEYAIREYEKNHTMAHDDREYWAEIVETIHD